MWEDNPGGTNAFRPVFFDMGTNADNWNVNGYRYGTAAYRDRDMVSWRVEGSHDNTTWQFLDQQTDYPGSPIRYVLSPIFPLSFAPKIVFSAAPSTITSGGNATLSWNVTGATGVSIDNGIGSVASSGSQVVMPADGSTTYTLTASNDVYGTRTASATVLTGIAPDALALENPSFESDVNADAGGAFGVGALDNITGWTVIARDNSAYPSSAETAVGSANLTPANGSQALALTAGAAIAQQTSLKWSDLNAGDLLRITVAAGDRGTATTATPRWADDSFIGFSNGLATRVAATPGAVGWIGKVVGQSPAVSTPPNGYKSGTMGDVAFTYTVSGTDHANNGNVGIFIASLGNRDGTDNGADAPSVQSFWDHVRVEHIKAPGPFIASFAIDKQTMISGESATLSWDVTGADSVSISGIGSVAVSGSLAVSPVADTTYTLTATSASGTKTRDAAVKVKAFGPGTYRYVRYTVTALRDPLSNIMQLAELQLLSGSTVLTPTVNSSLGSNASFAFDGNLGTLWTKSNYLTGNNPGANLVLSFAQPALITGYRVGTSPDFPAYDPVGWILEGSNDAFTWSILDEVSAANVPDQRQRLSESFAVLSNYAPTAGAPTINSFTASSTTLKEGASATLSWDVADATAVSVTDIGAVAASGSVSVSPSSTLTYYLIAENASGRTIASVTIEVNRLLRDTIIAEFDDAQYETFFDGSLASELPSGEIFTTLDVGRLPSENTLRHIVVPFQLPNLGSGRFASADLRLRVTGGILGNKGRTTVRLFAIPGARDSSLPEATDVVNGTLNHQVNGILANAAILGETTLLNSFVDSGSTGATANALAQWLNDAYANGANAGKYVFLRLSPAALSLPESFNFGVSTGDDLEEYVPTLTVAFDAEPSAVPAIGYFNTVPGVIQTGQSAVLQWGTSGGTDVSIDNDIGAVAATGSIAVSPTANTTYTLTVGDGVTTQTATATVTVAPVNSYRYLRFTGLGTRSPSATRISISELQYYSFGTLLTGAVVSSDQGSSSNARLIDGLFNNNWQSSNAPAPFFPITYDYGTFVIPTTCRIGTNNSVTDTGSDPAAWRIEGSRDGQAWVTLNEQLDGASLIPTTRSVLSDSITTIPGAPFVSVSTNVPSILVGESATLTWSATEVSEVTIDNGIGVQAASGSITVSPSLSTTYTVSATVSGAGENLDGFNVTRSVNLRVNQGGLLATSYDTIPTTGSSSGFALFNPISGLLEQTPSASFTQTDPINYNSTNWTTVPGITENKYFSVLWQGVFDTSIDGTGQYTFGLNSNTGSVLYIDLNNDGDFADIGELVINKNSYTVTQVQRTATVLLYNPNGYRIAIGYWEDDRSANLKNFSAHFKKGNNVSFASLSTISGEFSHFKPTLVQPADSPAPVIAFDNTMQPIESVFRVASTVPTSFTFSASNLQGALTITAPTHFQVSNSGTGSWSSSVTQGAGGNFTGTVFVRITTSSGLPVAGPVSGNITLSSANAQSQTVPIPESTVLKRPGTITAVAASKTYGQPDPVFTYTKESSVSTPPSGFNNSDPLTGALGRAEGENAGVYEMTLGTLTNPNYDITFVTANFTINPATLAESDITLTRAGNAYTASASGVSGFTMSYVGRGTTTYGPSSTAPTEPGDYTVTATSADPNWTGSKSEDYTVVPADHPAFRVRSIAVAAGGGVTIVWDSDPLGVYTIEATDNLSDPQSWEAVKSNISSQGAVTSDTVAGNDAAKRFYRVKGVLGQP